MAETFFFQLSPLQPLPDPRPGDPVHGPISPDARDANVETIRLPARSPNLNAYAERFIRTIRQERLDRMILFGEASLQRAIDEFIRHDHEERHHQGLANNFIRPNSKRSRLKVTCAVANAPADYCATTTAKRPEQQRR